MNGTISVTHEVVASLAQSFDQLADEVETIEAITLPVVIGAPQMQELLDQFIGDLDRMRQRLADEVRVIETAIDETLEAFVAADQILAAQWDIGSLVPSPAGSGR
ncbi:MAG: hypothetical protein ACI8TP_000161 [Acidimicrobiales bacterium]|jgi:hypothetical protein